MLIKMTIIKEDLQLQLAAVRLDALCGAADVDASAVYIYADA